MLKLDFKMQEIESTLNRIDCKINDLNDVLQPFILVQEEIAEKCSETAIKSESPAYDSVNNNINYANHLYVRICRLFESLDLYDGSKDEPKTMMKGTQDGLNA